MQREADENLASHFVSVQSISDTTTLPQMLEELERHLNRAASLDALILQLRCGALSPHSASACPESPLSLLPCKFAVIAKRQERAWITSLAVCAGS